VRSARDAGKTELPAELVSGLRSVQRDRGPGTRASVLSRTVPVRAIRNKGLRDGIRMRERRETCGGSQNCFHATSQLAGL